MERIKRRARVEGRSLDQSSGAISSQNAVCNHDNISLSIQANERDMPFVRVNL